MASGGGNEDKMIIIWIYGEWQIISTLEIHLKSVYRIIFLENEE
jgi:hypothetical protein